MRNAFTCLMYLSALLMFWYLAGCSGDKSTDDAIRDSDTDVDDSDSNDVPIVPELAPIGEVEAERLGAYVRQVLCSAYGNPERPVAWSAINASCQDRAAALQLAIAQANPSLSGEPPVLVDTDLTLDRLEELAAHPSFDIATINATGPFATYQSLFDEDGAQIGDQEMFFWWSYHHGVVLNVDGEMRVLDLSLGDAPVSIADWLAGFVDDPQECVHASYDVWSEVWVYWNACYQNFEPPDPPPVTCAYTITPVFTLREDQTVADQATAVRESVNTMNTQTDVFLNTVEQTLGVQLTDGEVASVLSGYRAGTLDDVCDWQRMRFCDDR